MSRESYLSLSGTRLDCWKNLGAAFPLGIWLVEYLTLGKSYWHFLPGGYYWDHLWKHLIALFSVHPDVCTSQMFTVSPVFFWREELSLLVSVGFTYMDGHVSSKQGQWLGSSKFHQGYPACRSGWPEALVTSAWSCKSPWAHSAVGLGSKGGQRPLINNEVKISLLFYRGSGTKVIGSKMNFEF